MKVNARGFIEVDERRRTAEPSIYAIGDVVGEPMLAHKASHEARVAVDAIAGERVAFEPQAIPAVVFTDPELAWCGLTETEAKNQKLEVAVARYPWAASGRALTLDRSDGVTKLVLHPQSGRVLGVGIVGPGAGELISEAVLAIEMGATAEDLETHDSPASHPVRDTHGSGRGVLRAIDARLSPEARVVDPLVPRASRAPCSNTRSSIDAVSTPVLVF